MDIDTVSMDFYYFDGIWHYINSGSFDAGMGLWYCYWDTTDLDIEDLIISANASDEVDLAGFRTVSGIEVDNTIPTPELLTPLSDEIINEIYKLTATCDSDTETLDFIYYDGKWNYIGDAQYDSENDVWFFNWDTSGLDIMNVKVYANATDELGQMGSDHSIGIAIDNTAPEIISTTPADGAENVSVVSSITIRFSEPIDRSVFEDYLTSRPGNEDYNYVWNTDGTIVTITSLSEFEQNRAYTVFLGTEIKDVAGNTMAAEYTWTFKTLLDTDNDGVNDYVDNDDDNDDVQDSDDAFPKDPLESVDTDGDGIGNNADLDDDGDSYFDDEDEYPLDPSKWEKGDDEGPSEGLWIWFTVIIAAIIVIIIGYIIYRKRKEVPQSIEKEKSSKDLTFTELE